MHHIRKTISNTYSLVIVVALLLSGCYQVRYDYNVPRSASECPTGMDYRSGGSAIVDRSGGSGIVDRDGNDVIAYCYVPNCPGNWDDTVPAVIDWHQADHHIVTGKRKCLAGP